MSYSLDIEILTGCSFALNRLDLQFIDFYVMNISKTNKSVSNHRTKTHILKNSQILNHVLIL